MKGLYALIGFLVCVSHTLHSDALSSHADSRCPLVNPSLDVLLAAEDCQHFYKCDRGVAVLQDCPAGLEWSTKAERCEWPHEAQCSIGASASTSAPISTTTKPVPQTSESTPSGSCPPVNGPIDVLLPAGDCQHFYKCDHGVPVLLECPDGLEWSQSVQRCEWPVLAGCSGGVNPSSPKPTTTNSIPTTNTDTTAAPSSPAPGSCPTVNGPIDVLLPAEDCQHFYKCDHGVPVLLDCPDGLEWSQSAQHCEWPDIAGCSGESKPTSSKPKPTTSNPNPTTERPVTTSRPETTSNTNPAPGSCPAVNGPIDVLLPAEDCQHFYKCDHGVPVLQDCPEGLDWSQSAQRCDWPEIAGCSSGSKPPGPNPTETTAVHPKPTTSNPNPTTGRPVTTSRPETTPNTSNPAPGSCPPVNGPIDVLLPAEDCQHFYKCDHGIPVLQDCPEGLDWSQSAQRCEWPEIAGCSSGSKPPGPNPTETTAVSPKPTTSNPNPTTGRPGTTSSPETSPNTSNPAPGSCPPVNGPIDVLLPAEDCQHFYKCDHGVPVLQDCPEGLDWSQSAQRCEWPEIAGCSSGSKTPGPNPTETTAVKPNPTTSNPNQTTRRPVTTSRPETTPNTYDPAPGSCPPVNGPIDVLLPAEDCQHFYKCDHGIPVLQDCPEGLDWSQSAQRCEWPEIAGCSSGSKPPGPNPTETTAVKPNPTTSNPNPTTRPPGTTSRPETTPNTSDPAPGSCPPVNGPIDVLLPAEDCQHFYKCDHGVPVLQDCPEGLEWSQSAQRCEWPEIAGCSSGSKPPGPSPTETTAVKPNPTTSNPNPTTRPPGTTSRPETTPNTSDPAPGSCPPVNGPIDVLLPAEDCQHFYKCDHGVPVLQDCPEGLEWSQSAQRCEWPEIAGCSSGSNTHDPNPTETTSVKPNPSTSTPNPTTGRPVTTSRPETTPNTSNPLPGSCPPVNGPIDVLLPAEDCQHFYKCDHGVPVLQDCPEGLEWSQSAQRCEWPEIAGCSGGSKPTSSKPNPTTSEQNPTTFKPNPTTSEENPTTSKPVPTTSSPNPPSGICPPVWNGIDVLLPAENCRQFYHCDNGVPVLKDCPAELEWSIAANRCEWPEIAQCQSRYTYKSAAPHDQCPEIDGEDDVLLPADNCQQFYKCSHGKAVKQNCPSGLEWSQDLLRCDWPEIANCVNSVRARLLAIFA